MTTLALIGLARFLQDKGFDQPTTAAIVANAHHESAGNPGAIGDGGASVGLFQWHDERAQGLIDFAQRQGVSPKAPDAQYAYLLRELTNDYPDLVRRMSQTGSAAKAADLFQRSFERPKEIDPSRSETAVAVSEWIDRRRKADKEAAALKQQVPSAAGLVEPPAGAAEPPGAPTATPASLPGVSAADMVEPAPGAGGLSLQALLADKGAAVDALMGMGSGPTNQGPLAGLPIGQALAIPPRVTAFFGNQPAVAEVQKMGFTRALDEGDHASDVTGFLTDAGKLVNAAVRKAGFTAELPSKAALPEQASRAEKAAFDQEVNHQFVAQASAVIAKTPGWYGLDKKTQLKALEDAHKAAVDKALSPLIKPRAYTDHSGKRPVQRVTMGPVP